MLDKNGMPITEEVEIKIPAFRVVPVFDVSQTDGKELPDIGVTSWEAWEDHEDFMQALTEVSPVPITYERYRRGGKGIFPVPQTMDCYTGGHELESDRKDRYP